jgi:hypothetical protein
MCTPRIKKRLSDLTILVAHNTPLIAPLTQIVLEYESSIQFVLIATPYRIQYSWYLADDEDLFDAHGTLIFSRMNWHDHPLVPEANGNNKWRQPWSSHIMRIHEKLYAFCSYLGTFWVSDLAATTLHWEPIAFEHPETDDEGQFGVLDESIYFFLCDRPVSVFDTKTKKWRVGSQNTKNLLQRCSTVIRVPETSDFLCVGGQTCGDESKRDDPDSWKWEMGCRDIVRYDTKEDAFSVLGDKLHESRSEPACAWLPSTGSGTGTLLVVSGYGKDQIDWELDESSSECLNSYETIPGGQKTEMQLISDEEWKDLMNLDSTWSCAPQVMVDEIRGMIYVALGIRCYTYRKNNMERLSMQEVPWASSKCTIWNLVN